MDNSKCCSNTNDDACTSTGHNQHLCYLMYEGFHLKEPEKYKEIVSNAEYRCQNCGRTARSVDFLCDGVKL